MNSQNVSNGLAQGLATRSSFSPLMRLMVVFENEYLAKMYFILVSSLLKYNSEFEDCGHSLTSI